MQNDILFNNIYIGHSVEDAEKIRKETFDVKHRIEVAEEEASKPKDEEATGPSFREDPVGFAREKVDQFILVAKENPIEAVKQVPEVTGALVTLFLATTLIVVGAVGSSKPAAQPATKKGKEAAGSSQEKKSDEATSTSADTGKGEATKRTNASE